MQRPPRLSTDGGTDGPGRARYVFAVRFHLAPATSGVSVEPRSFETTLFRRAETPGEDGWRFFRDNLWRGELGDERFMREEATEALGVPVDSVAFRELRTDEAYLDALKAEIATDLAAFSSDTVSEALSKYLGSSIHVVESDSLG